MSRSSSKSDRRRTLEMASWGLWSLERWFVSIIVCFFVGMVYWLSPASELRELRWKIIGLNYGLQDSPNSVIEDGDFSSFGPQESGYLLGGGARAFELTGPSIKEFLLDTYEDADVFVHSPADGDVHKLTLLEGFPHLAAIRIFEPQRINETNIAKSVLTPRGSPKGIQGLLQYFRLVEGCLGMIEGYESLHNFKYSWVIRTRVDGYWNAPMPPIDAFNSSYYHVPYGSGYGGLNDRLGIGTRAMSTVALARLSLLPKIHGLGYRGLYSETAFEAQFTACNVTVKLSTFPFCVLSTRNYTWPPRRYGVPVMSISSKGPLNGAKCRPCTPKLVGPRAEAVVNAIDRSIAWVGPTEDPELCDARDDWEDHWEDVFDAVAGQERADARQKISSRTLSECIKDIEEFQQQWEVWDAPSARVLCERGSLKDS